MIGQLKFSDLEVVHATTPPGARQPRPTASSQSRGDIQSNFQSSDAEFGGEAIIHGQFRERSERYFRRRRWPDQPDYLRGHRQSKLPQLVPQTRWLFIFDNLYFPFPTGTAFDFNGLLFNTADNPGGDWNLWASPPGAYSLYESANASYTIEESGTLSLASAPEPSTWATLGLRFVALTFVGRCRRHGARLAPAPC